MGYGDVNKLLVRSQGMGDWQRSRESMGYELQD